MPLLSEGLCPQLTSEVVNECRNIGIQTVTAFVSANSEDLVKKTKLSYKDLVSIRHALLTKYAAFPQRADSLYCMLVESLYIISSGSKRVDSFLKGGIYTGEVTEIHGPPASGKTQFSLSITASLIQDSENTALYLDTNNNFTARRFEQILAKKCESKCVSEKLQRVRVVNVRDVYHLFTVLEHIRSELTKMENEFFLQLKLIVIDSITPLLSPCFGGKYFDGPSFMSNIAQMFKLIYFPHMISIMVTNNTVQSATNDIKAGLGQSWKYVPSVSLSILKLNGTYQHKIKAMKSCRNGCFKEAAFVINDAGVTD